MSTIQYVLMKSELRVVLEKLEMEIFISWMRDLDKTAEILQIREIIEQLIISDSLEAYFNNDISDIEYFCKKFVKETISNLLKQSVIYGNKGDEVALSLLISYSKLFIKYCDQVNTKPYITTLVENLKEVFDYSKSFYKEFGNIAQRVGGINNKKGFNSEKYNELLPRLEKKTVEFKEGDYVDVLIDNSHERHYFNNKQVWVRGRVKEVLISCYIVFTMEKSNIQIRKDSNEICEVGKMTVEYDFRTSLKENDVVDGYDRGRWYPATILVSNI